MKLEKNIKKILIISLLFVPMIVFAGTGEYIVLFFAAIMMEAFVSIHMSLFVLKPLSEIFSKDNSKQLFWRLFAIRAVFLLFCDLFIASAIMFIDFISVFIGAFIVVPICASITGTKINARSNQVIKVDNQATTRPSPTGITGIELKCAKCNSVIQITDKFCPMCGEAIDGNNVVVSENPNSTVQVAPKVAVLPTNFDSMYSLTEDKMLEEFISRELTKAGIGKNSKLVPSEILKRKRILNIIFSVLVFVYITLIFFHFPIYTYIIGIILLLIFFKITRRYNLIQYLKKQIKARPSEKISNIVINTKNTFIVDNTKTMFLGSLLVAIVLPLVIFSTPKIIYEKTNKGYAVRYYAFGLTNFKTATIPETYKNEKVVSLRGNTFSNMPLLESVSLPDTITEIRGQAFKNCIKLSNINIPSKLEYLGGGAFYNAASIKSIELPDTLTYMGGEVFYQAESLESVKLSKNLSEIRGDSFEYCTSLRSIEIPDNIVRIGGHAFYGDYLLSEVILTENSRLSEIGSSAFRECSSLATITIPNTTYVDMRAFKESPTVINYFSNESSDIINQYNE